MVTIRKRLQSKYGTVGQSIRFGYHMGLYHLGRYRSYRTVNWSAVNRLVFVCAGNLWRSPYAEAAARQRGVKSVSGGLDVTLSSGVPHEVVLLAKQAGLDLTTHRSSPIKDVEIFAGDLLLFMEPAHVGRLSLGVVPANTQKSLLGLWCAKPSPYIPDPCAASPQYLPWCLARIREATERVVRLVTSAPA